MIGVYKNRVNDIVEEVRKIFEENNHSQDIHISIDCELGCVPSISFEVKNRFPQVLKPELLKGGGQE